MVSPELDVTAKLFWPSGEEGAIGVPYVPTEFDRDMMALALEQAEIALEYGDNPVGAVLVHNMDKQDKAQVFKAHSTEASDKDLTAHAEVNTYNQAKDTLGRNLGACAIYITAEPCVACTYYLYKGEVKTIYYAANRQDANGFFREKTINYEDLLLDSGRTILVVSGLLKSEAVQLMDPRNRRH